MEARGRAGSEPNFDATTSKNRMKNEKSLAHKSFYVQNCGAEDEHLHSLSSTTPHCMTVCEISFYFPQLCGELWLQIKVWSIK